MSGGSLDYAYHKIDDIIYLIKKETHNPLHLAFVKHLELVSNALHDLEWAIDSDISMEDAEPAIRKVISKEKYKESLIEDAKYLIKIIKELE